MFQEFPTVSLSITKTFWKRKRKKKKKKKRERERIGIVKSRHPKHYSHRIRQVTEKFNMAHFINSFRVLTNAVGFYIQTQPRLTIHKSVKYFKRQNNDIPDVHRNSVYTLL